jgi:hypothetical protein
VTAPSLLIELEYESTPKLVVRALSDEDEAALWSWLTDSPALIALATALVDLHRDLRTDEREAA